MTKMMTKMMASLPAPVTEVDGRLLPISVVENARRGIVARCEDKCNNKGRDSSVEARGGLTRNTWQMNRDMYI